jgi:AraC family transcriptional regulator
MALNRIIALGTVPIALPSDGEFGLSVRGLSKSRLIASEIRYGKALPSRRPEFPKYGDAYSIGVTFKDQQSDMVIDGKTSSVVRQTSQVQILNIAAVNYVDFTRPRHGVEIILSRKFITEIADDLEVPDVTHVGRGFRELTVDPALRALALRIHPCFDTPEALDPPYADHFMWALGVAVCAKYGDLAVRRVKLGGLATWQERLAKDVIETCLVGGIGLAELAKLCGLRTSQFAHAFKRSTGVAPYQWLLRRRIARAEDLLLAGRNSLADIALLCGFADQSHLTRAFSRLVGATPRAWRAAMN